MYKTTEGSFGKQVCMTLQFTTVLPFINPWYLSASIYLQKQYSFPILLSKKKKKEQREHVQNYRRFLW